MTERNRLLQLIEQAEEKFPTMGNLVFKMTVEEYVADCLIENGVVILPCKVGDTVYSIWEDDDGNLQIDEAEIVDVSIHKIWVNGGDFDVNCLGKSDFLSREEAEKALKEREQCSTKD